ncbi:phosphatase PAP2 family protein [Spiroplasma monobiae]|uniref:Phosphatidic acid phosphatase type 2/haloperoxidase domain-containing protein n=1 Tax=Spiroplasma monobiae MQ-1 TaxID=1336748 RepID=A0A2K9LVB0_SPISQ|nr:phosphatase PAP2 family protein [Spiroplasma monobiae]AUM62861.1 hypothetical protein SMONO_v1c06120 [Spiroplasma monobiae MQ-1]
MFYKSDKNYKLLKILFLSFFVFTIISFIVASIFDYQINVLFAKGMDIYWLKIVVWVYEEMGMTQSYLFIFIFIAVYLEVKKIENKEKDLWNYILWTFYGAVATFWFVANIYWIVTTTKINDGFGIGISGWFLESYSIRQIILIVIFIFETTAFAIAFWYIRFKFIKRPDVLSAGYKVDAIKAFSAFIVSSLIVYLMKFVFGRPYFYSVIFDELFYSDRMEESWRTYWIQEGHKIKSWGILDPKTETVSGVEYLGWWQINDLFGDFKNWFKPLGTGNPGRWNMDFPSGHMVSCFTMLYSAYFFIGEKKKRKINWKIWTLIGIWFLHMNIMQYTQIVSRTHWITDTAFTIALSMVIIMFNSLIIEKIIEKQIAKQKNKKTI